MGIDPVRPAAEASPTARALTLTLLPLSQAAEAHRLISGNEVKGNIVLLPRA